MIPCVQDHFDVDPCPNCGTHHKPFESLPSTMFTHEHFQALGEIDAIDGVKPIFRIHLEEEDDPSDYFKASPLITLINGDTIRVLWFEPDHDAWVVVDRVEEPEDTFAHADEISDEYRHLTTEIYNDLGYSIIDNDPRP